MALGLENAVHLALTDALAADRVLAHLSRWQFFTGWSRDATNRDSDPHASPSAGEVYILASPDVTAASYPFCWYVGFRFVSYCTFLPLPACPCSLFVLSMPLFFFCLSSTFSVTRLFFCLFFFIFFSLFF